MGEIRIGREFHDGHFIIYDETFSNLANHLPPPFERWHTFPCKVNSTSFMFRVTFQSASNDGGVECVVWIRRVDDRDIGVDVELWLSAIPRPSSGVRVPLRRTGWNGMQRYEETTLTVKAFIPNDILTQLADRDVLFQTLLGVHGCHGERDAEGSYRRRDTPPPPEELRLLSNM